MGLRPFLLSPRQNQYQPGSKYILIQPRLKENSADINIISKVYADVRKDEVRPHVHGQYFVDMLAVGLLLQ